MADYLANSLTPIESIDGEVINYLQGVTVYLNNNTPLVAIVGDIWYEPDTNTLYVYTPTGWVPNTSIVVTNNSTAPTTPAIGDYWYDPDDLLLYQWNGTTWVVVAGAVVAVTKALKLNYSQLTPLSAVAIKLPYQSVPIAVSTLDTPYDILFAPLIPVSLYVRFDYVLLDGKISDTLVLPYVIQNNRLRWSLNKFGGFYYSLGNPVPVTNTARFNYADMLPVASALKCKYGNATVATSTLKLNYSKATAVSTVLGFSYSKMTAINATERFLWALRENVSLTTQFDYEISAKSYIFIEGKFGYSIENLQVQSINASPVLYKNGEEINYIVVRLSCDENSPYWMGEVSLANIEDFSKFNVEDEISLYFSDAIFNLIIDGKHLSRDDNANQSCQLTFISPAALLDSPFASTITKFYSTPQIAREVVVELLGEVQWTLPEWVIPIEQCQFTNSTPMAIARRIVGAVGGLVESLPNGDIICRKAFPVSVPAYPTAQAIPLSDSDLFAITEQIAPQKIVNRLDLFTQLASSSIQDTVEYVGDEGTSTSGVIHGYPSPYRNVNLVHTGDSAVAINAVGDFTRTETAFVEFKQGVGNTNYPIDSIQSIEWHRTNLGGVTFEGKNLYSSVLAESLLKITYTVKSKRYNVSGDELTQFLLQDA